MGHKRHHPYCCIGIISRLHILLSTNFFVTDIFLDCLTEAETSENEYSRRAQIISGMYNNYSYEIHFDHLIERVLKSEHHFISSGYWRNLAPAIQCQETTAHIVDLLEDASYSEFIPALCDSLITKDLIEHEQFILTALSREIENEEIENILSLCKLLCRETTESYGNILAGISDLVDPRIHSDYAVALGYQLTLDDFDLLLEIFGRELRRQRPYSRQRVQISNFTKSASILMERYLTSNSLELFLPWLSNDTLALFAVNIIGKLGGASFIPHLTEILNDNDTDELSNGIRVALSMISNREVLPRINEPIEWLNNSEKILFKAISGGQSDTKFFGYYTGIKPNRILNTEQRREILLQILQTDFVFSRSQIPVIASYQYGTSHDKRRSSMLNLLGNLTTRQAYALENAQSRPWHPQGLYTYAILSQDAKWIADRYGEELGIHVGLILTNIPGVYSFRVYDLMDFCSNECRGLITMLNDNLTCTNCGETYPDSEPEIFITGQNDTDLLKLDIIDGGYRFNDSIEFTNEEVELMLETYQVIIGTQIPEFSEYIAAIHSNIEEMLEEE